MYVAPEHRERIVPLVTSWNAPEGFVSSFSYLGTDDYTPYLTVPTAIEFMGTLGWERVRTHNRALSRMGGDMVRETIDGKPEWSVDEGLFEAMTIVALPGASAETLVIALDLAGIAVSAGAACSSGKVGTSHVLAAMGVAPQLARGAIRISLGHGSTERDVASFLGAWSHIAVGRRERAVA